MTTQATDLSNLRHKPPVTGLTKAEAFALRRAYGRRSVEGERVPAVKAVPEEGEETYRVERVS